LVFERLEEGMRCKEVREAAGEGEGEQGEDKRLRIFCYVFRVFTSSEGAERRGSSKRNEYRQTIFVHCDQG